MNTTEPHINDILDSFFNAYRARKKGVALQRINQVETRLYECLELDGPAILVTADQELLLAEREFAPNNAMARTMHAGDLIFVIGLFLEPPWLAAELAERRVQVAVCSELLRFVFSSGLVNRHDFACHMYSIEASIRQARSTLQPRG